MIVPLTQGFEAIVDDEDFYVLSLFKWSVIRQGSECNPLFYASTNTPYSLHIPRSPIRMHRFIMGVLPTQQIDHKNGNGLDNRKQNLRVATRGQNRVNSRAQGKSSQYRGITKDVRWNSWKAKVVKNYVEVFCKSFPTELEAALAYDEAVREHHGEFAYTNFNKEGV